MIPISFFLATKTRRHKVTLRCKN